MKFMEKESDYSKEVLKFVKRNNRKFWVYDNSQKEVVERLGVLTMYIVNRLSLKTDTQTLLHPNTIFSRFASKCPGKGF